ncbi:ABC transporter ATP-binding protein [Actinomadura sp. KC345]|uniref:ABC transporter ATP-binding protein n=1 Tax=Actinomadura sp. KC345 TaxID=2530371 RepID=UPI0010530463|nr:ABC transporter ATP-binding protein [Actinomadura sp. KC345]TDC46606.1 ABC transporter ATP-binding protein [Actinomadura sp. KC345]
MSPALLEVEDLTLSFAGVRALDGVSFTIDEGEFFAVIGPNGAGKSTLFNCVSGIYRPQAGSIRFDGREILGRAPHRIAQAGIARTFQNVDVFPAMTVQECLLLARHQHLRSGPVAGMVRWGRSAREERSALRKVTEVADRLGLGGLLQQTVGPLPHGVQKRVELARSLCMEPRLLLLDEPVAGMNHEETAEMAATLSEVNADLGITMLLVEHDMSVVMGISTRICVLDFGRRIALDAPANVVRDEAVIDAYLGGAL